MPRPFPANKQKPTKPTTPFKEFASYENGRLRNFKFDVNALADFEQETGMGFAQLMKQKAVFGAARAMLWAGLKHEDRGLTVEGVGDLLSEYLRDEEVELGTHTIDSILMVAISAAVEQGALGRPQKADTDAPQEDTAPNALTGEVIPPETTN